MQPHERDSHQAQINIQILHLYETRSWAGLPNEIGRPEVSAIREGLAPCGDRILGNNS